MSNLDIYNAVRIVPKEAQKTIGAGRLKGMTDINPMWRIKTLTEQFGTVGVGWYYSIVNRWIEDGAEGEKCAFVEVELYIKSDGEWSKPIVGTGGSKFIANESKGPYTSDEAYKMALTDAISVACKALGMGADVYWNKDTSKYNAHQDDEPPVIPVKITEQQIANLEAVFAAQPDGGKALRIIVLGDKDIKELTNVEYGNILNQVQKIGTEKAWVKKNVDRYVKAYAGKVKKSYEDCYRELEEVLNVKFEEQTKESIVPILKRIEELANGGY